MDYKIIGMIVLAIITTISFYAKFKGAKNDYPDDDPSKYTR